MRRALVILIVLAVVVAVSWVGYEQFGKAKAQAAPDYETVNVDRGDVSSTVSATGSVLPEREANLNFQGAGTVARVAVEIGDRIDAGQVLAELDTTDLDLAVRQAEIGLRQTEAQLKQLSEGPNASDLAAAQAALESAQAGYEQVLKGSDKDQLAAANAQVEQARVALEQAQQAYDQVKDRPNAGMFPQSLQLQQATINYETAQANYRVTARGANAAQVAAAQAQIAQAQATLDRLNEAPSSAQVEVAQAAVDQARLGVEQAQRRLDNAAHCGAVGRDRDGGEFGAGHAGRRPGRPCHPDGRYSRFHLDVQVDEVDVAGIGGRPVGYHRGGCIARANADRQRAERCAGGGDDRRPAACRIRCASTSIQARPLLRAGMSATATIVSSTRENVLLIPNRAVQLDRETGRTFVERLDDG